MLLAIGMFSGCPTDDAVQPVDDSMGTPPDVDVSDIDDTTPREEVSQDILVVQPDEGEPELPRGCLSDGQCVEELAGTLLCKTAICEDGVCYADSDQSQNGAPCESDDLCTGQGTCQLGECVGELSDCEDGNPCTEDSCDPDTGECVHEDVGCPSCAVDADCVPYESTNPCHGTLHCVTGACLKDAPTVVDCWAAQTGLGPCEQSVCNPKNGECQSSVRPDGSSCTPVSICEDVGTCLSGVCSGPPVMCDDGDPCTQDTCDGGCKFAGISGPVCDDGDECTTDDGCMAGVCKGTPLVDCDDGDVCTNDTCNVVTGSCIHTNNNALCDDGNECTVSDHCDSGECVASVVLCDDQTVCTIDSCDPATGCKHVTINCNDGDACTDDSCDPKSGCVNALPGTACATDADCSDGLSCTDDFCSQGCGLCKHNAKICDDETPCTTETCVEPGGQCQATFVNGGACDDGDPCTSSDVCSQGVCVGGISNACNCLGEPNGSSCDDGSADTVADFCFNDVCGGFQKTVFVPATTSTNVRFSRLEASGNSVLAVGSDERIGVPWTWAAAVVGSTVTYHPQSARNDSKYLGIGGGLAVGTNGRVGRWLGGSNWQINGTLQTAVDAVASSLGPFGDITAAWSDGSVALLFGRNASNSSMKISRCDGLAGSPVCKSIGLANASGYWPRTSTTSVAGGTLVAVNAAGGSPKSLIIEHPGAGSNVMATIASLGNSLGMQWTDVAGATDGQIWGVGTLGLTVRGVGTAFASLPALPGKNLDAVAISGDFVFIFGTSANQPTLWVHERGVNDYVPSAYQAVTIPDSSVRIVDAVVTSDSIVVIASPVSGSAPSVSAWVGVRAL